MKSPFKFLDSYTKDDRDIFFGRDREIEELYQRVFDSRLLLVYGVSGTGKSSLIHCGLANKFLDTDWLPIIIRRGGNIIGSMAAGIRSASITAQHSKFATPGDFRKAVRSLYLDHYKPVFFIFDQFEELFIFGDKEERKTFIQIVKTLTESDLQCRMIFVMREEYMAGVTEFERYIPTFFANRVRIEKMSHVNALEAIKGPCKAFIITLEDGFAESLLEKLSPGETDVELTYLQVFLDKIFQLATGFLPPLGGELKGGSSYSGEESKGGLTFTLLLLEKAGNVSDLLGSFLDEQIALLDDPQTGLSILKNFVSIKGTRKQLSEEEIQESARTFGKEIAFETIKDYLHQFVNLRILKEKNEAGCYELRHDSLADKIFGKISMMERELLEVINFLDTAYHQYEKRGAYLSEADLKYIQYFDDKQAFKGNRKFTELIDSSRKNHTKARRKRRQMVASLAIGLIIILSALSVWAINQRGKAIAQKNEALAARQEAQTARGNADKARLEAVAQRTEAEAQRVRAEFSEKTAKEEEYKAVNARILAENELYRNIKNSLSVSAEAMNVLYAGIDNPVTITVSGIPSEKLSFTVENGIIQKGKVKNSEGTYFDGDYTIQPEGISKNVILTVYGEIKPGKKDSIGSKTFRVKTIPKPYPTFAGKNGGEITKVEAISQPGVFIKTDMDLDMQFIVTEFEISVNVEDVLKSYKSYSNLLTDEQKSVLNNLESGNMFLITNIYAKVGPAGKPVSFSPMVFKMK